MYSREKYAELAGSLQLNFACDAPARDLLAGLLKVGGFTPVEKLISGRTAYVFGCGPSLRKDIMRIKKKKLIANGVLIAADGAARALLENGMTPGICVTDLDGDIPSIIKAGRLGCITIVHAHGDNMPALKEYVRMIPGVKLGTTQAAPKGHILNFGGFTDGDRAVYMAVHYNAAKIILFGMDFGRKVGEYSGKKGTALKLQKLAAGKRLLEELAANTKIPILNATGSKLKLRNIPSAGKNDGGP